MSWNTICTGLCGESCHRCVDIIVAKKLLKEKENQKTQQVIMVPDSMNHYHYNYYRDYRPDWMIDMIRHAEYYK